MNHFHTAKVGPFLHACKFFCDFWTSIWRQGGERATDVRRRLKSCRIGTQFLQKDGMMTKKKDETFGDVGK